MRGIFKNHDGTCSACGAVHANANLPAEVAQQHLPCSPVPRRLMRPGDPFSVMLAVMWPDGSEPAWQCHKRRAHAWAHMHTFLLQL
eukprot:363670-Chlamydomonas_euryale.AAC.3